ncbi:hypothetical protein HAX54_049551 [Datura stramonium]|uniref:Vesicle-fusing ATPase n=1 Tax=Datura stramonium TaxID=4076 RepID=A0ABS8SVD1_DATST|nr:hypothetical protein [Datura stramonium]
MGHIRRERLWLRKPKLHFHLRPGRFELRLRIDLPDEDTRLKILQINSKRMQRRISLDTDIDLSAVASATQGFTRVDLEGLLQTALEKRIVS